MLINSVNDNVSFEASFYERFFKSFPNANIKDSARYNKFGQKLASPHWNRTAIGVAAFFCQPPLDYFNKKVDRDTAEVSAIRTIAKTIACSGVGFVVRGASYKLTEKFCNGAKEEGSTFLTPKEILNIKNAEVRNKALKLHKNAFSTISALIVMIFTNFLLDAPLTTHFSNLMLDKYNKWKSYKKEVTNE